MTHVNNILDDLKLPRSEDLQVNLKTIQDVLSNLAQTKEFNLPENYEWWVSDECRGLKTPRGLLIYNGYDSISAYLVTPANIKPVFPNLNVLENELKELENLTAWFNKGLVTSKSVFDYLATQDINDYTVVEVNALSSTIKMVYSDNGNGLVESETSLLFSGYPEVDTLEYKLMIADQEVLSVTGCPTLILGLLNSDYDLPKEVLNPKTIRPGFEIIKEIVPKKVIKGIKFTCGTLRPSIGFEANMSFEDETTKLELKDLTSEMNLSITLHGCRCLFDVFKGLN